MAPAGLLSCLGVAGWGPLHLLLPRDGDPDALLGRLRRAWWQARQAGEGEPPAARLLACLLRSQPDLRPLLSPGPGAVPVDLGFRHRLVQRPGQRTLQLRSWQCTAPAHLWRPCGEELRLDGGLLAGPAVAWPDPQAAPERWGAAGAQAQSPGTKAAGEEAAGAAVRIRPTCSPLAGPTRASLRPAPTPSSIPAPFLPYPRAVRR